MLGAAGDDVALPAVGAVRHVGPRHRGAHDLDARVEPRPQLVDVLALHCCLALVAADEVGPDDAQRLVTEPPAQTQHREADGLELERVVRHATAPQVELAQLLGAVAVDEREVDPAADTQLAGARLGGLVEAVVVQSHRPVAEHLRVPTSSLFEHCALLDLEVGPDAVEVRRGRRPQLGVDVRDAGEERLAHPGAVHGVVGAGSTLDLLGQPPTAHRLRASQQVGRDLR